MNEAKQKAHFSKLYDEMDKATVKMTEQFGEDLVWALRKHYDDLVHLTPGSLGEKMVLSAMREYAELKAINIEALILHVQKSIAPQRQDHWTAIEISINSFLK